MSKTSTLADIASSNSALVVPTGGTASRPSANAGSIRFNTDLGTLESANGTAWANVGSGSASSGGSYDANTTSTGFLSLPQGTLAQRPANAANGAFRWNTSNSWAEMYTGQGGWQIISGSYNIQYIVVAGGGSGGTGTAGGGGAGGVVTGSITPVTVGTSYTLVVGAGGAASSYQSPANSGSNSTGFGQTVIGGGAGAGLQSGSVTNNPASGGSGGGAGSYNGTSSSNAGSGTNGQGYPGGAYYSSSPWGAGGGGGATSAGGNASSVAGGDGGSGYQWLNGNSYGGGGGGASGTTGGLGGVGGGGQGSQASGVPSGYGVSGSPSTGGGGGGAWNYSPNSSGAGGGGVIIVRYPGTPRGTGGTITQSGGYTYHTFTSSGTFTA